MRRIIRTEPKRSRLASAVFAVALLPMLAAPAAPPATTQGAGCQYAFPRVRAWQLAQAELAGGRAGAPADTLVGLNGTPC